jgi:hypothetical protein
VTGQPVICSFWHGPFGWLERLCIGSFLRHGHRVEIYAYEPIAGLPEGATWRNAAEVVPRDRVFFYKGTGTIGVFADYFRLVLQQRSAGIWVDCDMYCVRPFPAPGRFLFGYERAPRADGRGGSVNNAVLYIAPDEPLLDDLLSIFIEGKRPLLEPHLPLARRLEVAAQRLLGRNVPPQNMQFGATGPFALTHFIDKRNMRSAVSPADVFYPVPYEGIPALMQPGSSIDAGLTPRTLGVHIWLSQLTRRGRSGLAKPAPKSALYELCVRDGVAL